MKVRAHIFVDGRVQGVFFRSKTRFEANNRNVNGWVRNKRNGRVEAVFEGEEDSVKNMIAFCRKGPPGARVIKLDVKWLPYRGEFSEFEIRYDHYV